MRQNEIFALMFMGAFSVLLGSIMLPQLIRGAAQMLLKVAIFVYELLLHWATFAESLPMVWRQIRSAPPVVKPNATEVILKLQN